MNPENLALADNGTKVAFQGLGDPFGSNADNSREIFVVDIDGGNWAQAMPVHCKGAPLNSQRILGIPTAIEATTMATATVATSGGQTNQGAV